MLCHVTMSDVLQKSLFVSSFLQCFNRLGFIWTIGLMFNEITRTINYHYHPSHGPQPQPDSLVRCLWKWLVTSGSSRRHLLPMRLPSFWQKLMAKCSRFNRRCEHKKRRGNWQRIQKRCWLKSPRKAKLLRKERLRLKVAAEHQKRVPQHHPGSMTQALWRAKSLWMAHRDPRWPETSSFWIASSWVREQLFVQRVPSLDHCHRATLSSWFLRILWQAWKAWMPLMMLMVNMQTRSSMSLLNFHYSGSLWRSRWPLLLLVSWHWPVSCTSVGAHVGRHFNHWLWACTRRCSFGKCVLHLAVKQVVLRGLDSSLIPFLIIFIYIIIIMILLIIYIVIEGNYIDSLTGRLPLLLHQQWKQMAQATTQWSTTWVSLFSPVLLIQQGHVMCQWVAHQVHCHMTWTSLWRSTWVGLRMKSTRPSVISTV